MLSEPIQLALATKRYGLSGSTALATLVVEHVLDVLATVILMALGVIFIPELRAIGIPLVGSAILFVVTLGVFLVVAKGIDTLPFVGRMGFMEREPNRNAPPWTRKTDGTGLDVSSGR